MHAIDYEWFINDEPRRVHGACRRPSAGGRRSRQLDGRRHHRLSRRRQRHADYLARSAGRREFGRSQGFSADARSSSLRVEGEAGAKLTIGAIDARPPRAAPPVNLPELDKRIEALKDERANLQGAIDAATARRKFAERFAEALRPESAIRARRGRSPNGARPLPRSARKSPAPMPRSATPSASSANSTAKSRVSNRTGRKSRRARWKSGSNSHRPPRPRRRCG